MSASWVTRALISGIAVGLASFHIYAGYGGTFYPYTQRTLPVLLAVILVFLTVRARKQNAGKPIPFYDWILAALAVPSIGYILVFSDYLTDRWPLTPTFAPTPFEVTIALVGTFLLLESCRRIMGSVLSIMVLLALAYAYFGEYVGWMLLSHRGFTFLQVVDHMYLTLDGVWGSALSIAVGYIVLFVLFGAFAERAGATTALLEFASAIAGHLKGGPAKVAIISSGMVGSVTGSTVANVYTTGQFTIPMMKRIGYRPPFAGAVEALASNGGQIMPPVMGAAAFIIAAYAGIPYAQVALASLVPALIYYAGLYWYIHLEAVKHGLEGIPRSEKPAFLTVLIRRGYLVTPLIVLIGLMVYGMSPIRAAFYSIIYTVAVSWLRRESRMGVREIFEAMERGAKDAVMIIIICAVIGYIIGTFTLTGLGLNLSSAIIHLSGGNYLALLIMVAVACLILGTGMNTVAAFLLVSVVAVPALIQQGIEPLVANMFVFYSALLSHITPPVCLAIFAAATIANASSWATAYEGLRMGIIAYLLPFIIIFYPSLLVRSASPHVLIDALMVLAGSMAIMAAIQGWLLTRMGWFERAWALIAGGLLLWPTVPSTIAGGVMVAMQLAYAVLRRRGSATAAPAEERPAE
jgi:TRAP transporter 4TM/12TM fusion protein